jgi:uncharacterized damage-inducible protein DinB
LRTQDTGCLWIQTAESRSISWDANGPEPDQTRQRIQAKAGDLMDAPLYPAGAFVPEVDSAPVRRDEFIAVIANAPGTLRHAVAGLADDALDTRYKNWTIRQIVNHLADSHVNSYVRFKWALTEDRPTIKAYDEGSWAALADSRAGEIEIALRLVDGLHARWVHLLRSMTEDQFRRAFHQPETGQTVTLSAALCYYAWHCRHHTAQITWLRRQRGW